MVSYFPTCHSSLTITDASHVAQAMSHLQKCLLDVLNQGQRIVTHNRFEAVSLEQLDELRTIGLTWTDIANFLGVNRMTVYRARQELGYQEPDDESIPDSIYSRWASQCSFNG